MGAASTSGAAEAAQAGTGRRRGVALRVGATVMLGVVAAALLLFTTSTSTPAAATLQSTHRFAVPARLLEPSSAFSQPSFPFSQSAPQPALQDAQSASVEPAWRRRPLMAGIACALENAAVEPAIRGLCDVIQPGMDVRLAAFFQAGRPPPLRVFVADMEDGRTGLGTTCGTFIDRYFVTHGAHQAAYATKFAAEVLIPGAYTLALR